MKYILHIHFPSLDQYFFFFFFYECCQSDSKAWGERNLVPGSIPKSDILPIIFFNLKLCSELDNSNKKESPW